MKKPKVLKQLSQSYGKAFLKLYEQCLIKTRTSPTLWLDDVLSYRANCSPYLFSQLVKIENNVLRQ